MGHNKVFIVDNLHKGGFKAKMDYTLSTVSSLLGLPSNKTRYKKFLLHKHGAQDLVMESELPTYHEKLFGEIMAPFNYSEATEFKHVSNFIKHSYLRAPNNHMIFVRSKAAVS